MKNIRALILISFVCLFADVYAQQGKITGTIVNSKTNEPLPGVNIVLDDKTGTITNDKGYFELDVSAGKHALVFRFIGFEQRKHVINIQAGETKTVNVKLEESVTELELVVVSASRFEQKIDEITVSMEVIKPSLVENTNTTNMETIIDQTPGVNVVDGNVSIRGGSGFTYGAGSRVLMMVDDLPMLTGDASDIKWNFLPVENLEQIEVLKGASSALFGSSALNGVINLRTAYPKSTPETKIGMFTGFYDSPENREMKWWGDKTQLTSGTSIFHSRKIEQVDLVLGANVYSDDGYRLGEEETRIRGNINTRYRFKKIEGLSAGVNVNTMMSEGGTFMLWNDDSTGALIPQGAPDTTTNTLSNYKNNRLNVDPFITYIHKDGSSQKLRTRYFRTANKNDTGQQSFADVYFGEYQYQKKFNERFFWTSGVSVTSSDVESELYGDHTSLNNAFFSQIDAGTDKFFFSFGARWEKNKIDTVSADYLPVFRSGINYRLAKETYLRTSYGEGYRFPTIAEKFIMTNVGSLYIYPNDSIRPETGWSAEFGVKQGLKINNWRGYLDIAAFWTEYQDMMEFTFGRYGGDTMPLFGLGFKSLNVGNTQIRGFDVSLIGEGKLFGIPLSFFGGYTYMDPVQLDFDAKVDTLRNTSKNNILKYRFRHLAKIDAEAALWRFSPGISFRYNSFMENIDRIFEALIPGVERFRKEHNSGDYVFDARLSYRITDFARAAFLVKNVFNREYMGRPADLQPPRSFVLQVNLKF